MATLAPSIQLSPNCTVEILKFNGKPASGPPCCKCGRQGQQNGKHHSRRSSIQYYCCRKCGTYWSVRA